MYSSEPTIVVGKRKSLRLKLIFYAGSGVCYLNSRVISSYPEIDEVVKLFLKNSYFIGVHTGGGFGALPDAVLLCIFKYLAKVSDQSFRTLYPSGLKSNPKKKWKKLPQGRGARSKRQKSYR